MTNPALGFQGAVLGFGEESVFGTAVAVTKFAELNTDGFTVDEERLESGAIPAIYSDDDEVARGGVSVSGEAEIEMRFEGMEVLFKHAMGSVASAEVASFVVEDAGAGQNNKLDFNIGSTELTATVAAGTYAAGATQLIAGSLCKAIYDAIVAAEAVGVYTVSYSTTTKKFTITRSTGTFQILWNTGTNKAYGIAALLGYSTAADDTGALTYASDTATVVVYAHTFTLADALPTGLTFEVDRDVSAFTFEGCKINTMSLSIEQGGFLMMSIGIIGEDTTAGTATAQTLPTAPLVDFSGGVIQYGGSSVQVKKGSITLNNNLSSDRRFIGSRLIAEPMRTGKIEVTGTIVVEFNSTAQYVDFRAATSRAVILTFTGAVIKGALSYTITVTLPQVKLTGGVPMVKDAGAFEVELPFKAYAASSASREFNVVIQNTVVSVAA